MTKLEKTVEALRRCVPAAEFEKAMTEVEATETDTPAPRNTEAMIRELLVELGTPDHVLGHRYLVSALLAVVERPSLVHAIVYKLYPSIAAQYGTTGSRVERAIRTAIEIAWDRGDVETLTKYFGNTVNFRKGKPTNAEFLARVGNIIRQKLQEV